MLPSQWLEQKSNNWEGVFYIKIIQNKAIEITFDWSIKSQIAYYKIYVAWGSFLCQNLK